MADKPLIARFRSPLHFEDCGGFPFVLIDPLIYDSGVLNRTLTIPIGFKTDLASIPRALWGILPPIGKYDGAAVVHDALYQWGGVTRHQADSVLNEAMEVLSVRRTQRWTIIAGVMVGGWKVWNRYRTADSVSV